MIWKRQHKIIMELGCSNALRDKRYSTFLYGTFLSETFFVCVFGTLFSGIAKLLTSNLVQKPIYTHASFLSKFIQTG
jgi:hypothetical protein